MAYSPCPNDTFMFHDLAQGRLTLPGREIFTHLHDIEALNERAFEATYDLTKMSFFTYLMVKDTYRLLETGAALGFGCGPVVIAKRPIDPDALADCRVVLPGQWTTAHLLFRLFAPEAEDKRFVTYDRIMDELNGDRADCGVIIHESRFTFAEQGFVQIIDLGQWWEEQTGCPIPLGCLGINRDLGDSLAEQMTALIRESITNARSDPDRARPYIAEHAQEMDDAVCRRHIQTFVNDFSLDLQPAGRKAVERLEQLARERGIVR